MSIAEGLNAANTAGNSASTPVAGDGNSACVSNVVTALQSTEVILPVIKGETYVQSPYLSPESLPPTVAGIKRSHSPAPSTDSELTELSHSASAFNDSAVDALALLNGGPPSKKRKLTFEEKRQAEELAQVRRRERADQKAARERERAEKAVEKLQKDAEREQERLKKEAEKLAKQASKDADLAEKEKVRLAKEEEKRKVEEAKAKKERSQGRLTAFFGTQKAKPAAPALPPFGLAVSGAISQPKPPMEAEKSHYAKMFLDFFRSEHMTLAPINRFVQDDALRWTEKNKAEIDLCITRGEFAEPPTWDAPFLFRDPHLCLTTRGKDIGSMREIMAGAFGNAIKPIDLTTDSQMQNLQARLTRQLLKDVPLKLIMFSQDVRPPYKGTRTRYRMHELQKLARQPVKPLLPDVQYDYDSEAEWVEDGEEDGEDLGSDKGDEEVDDDNDEEADEFIDDEDAVAIDRKAIQHQQAEEAQYVRMSWENHKRNAQVDELYRYRIEVMHTSIADHEPIDPFSTKYWEANPPSTTMESPRAPLSSIRAPNTRNHIAAAFGIDIHPTTTKAPAATTDAPPQSSTRAATTLPNHPKTTTAVNAIHQPGITPISQHHQQQSLITDPSDLAIFKEKVEGAISTKLLLLEVLKASTSRKCTEKLIKASLECWAEHVPLPLTSVGPESSGSGAGSGMRGKIWRLKAGCGL